MWGPVVTAMVTPFRADGEVDWDAVDGLARYLVGHGSDALLVGGTTGESPTLSHDEKLALVRRVLDTVGGRAKVLAGSGSNDTRASVALTEEMTALGVDGLMLVCPYYNKPSQDGLYAHFAACARATRLPVMIYNIPGRTSRNIEPETIGRLAAELPNVVALKEASGDPAQFARVALAAPAGFWLYSGNDTDTPAVLACGGCGVVSVASHLVGPEIQSMIAAFGAGDFAEGVRLHLRLSPFYEALFPASAPNPAPLKAALAEVGLCANVLRLPLVPAPEPVRARLRDELSRLGLR